MVKHTLLNAPYMRNAWRVPQSAVAPRRHDALLLAARQGVGCPHVSRQALGAYVLPVYPSHTAGCSAVCLDREALKAGVVVGREAVFEALGPIVGRGVQVEGEGEGERVGRGVGAGGSVRGGVAAAAGGVV